MKAILFALFFVGNHGSVEKLPTDFYFHNKADCEIVREIVQEELRKIQYTYLGRVEVHCLSVKWE